jgi:hypothetical protein
MRCYKFLLSFHEFLIDTELVGTSNAVHSMYDPHFSQPVELPSGVEAEYRREYVQCGLVGCRKCSGGKRGHGPFWFAYWQDGDETRRAYVGKTKPEQAKRKRKS